MTKSLLNLFLPILDNKKFWEVFREMNSIEEAAFSTGDRIEVFPAIELNLEQTPVEKFYEGTPPGITTQVRSFYSVDFLLDPKVWGGRFLFLRGIDAALPSLVRILSAVGKQHLHLLKAAGADFRNLALFLISMEKFYWQKFLPKFRYFNSGYTAGVTYLNLVSYVENGLLPATVLKGWAEKVDAELIVFYEEKDYEEEEGFYPSHAEVPDYYGEMLHSKRTNHYLSISDWRKVLSDPDTFYHPHDLLMNAGWTEIAMMGMWEQLDILDYQEHPYSKKVFYEELQQFLSEIPLIE